MIRRLRYRGRPAMNKIPMTRKGLDELEVEVAAPQGRGAAGHHPRHCRSPRAWRFVRKRRVPARRASAKASSRGRIVEMEDAVSHAEVIDTSKLSGDTVRFGAEVMVADADTDKETSYRIVGAHEADAAAGRLSVTSPLSRALIGKVHRRRGRGGHPRRRQILRGRQGQLSLTGLPATRRAIYSVAGTRVVRDM